MLQQCFLQTYPLLASVLTAFCWQITSYSFFDMSWSWLEVAHESQLLNREPWEMVVRPQLVWNGSWWQVLSMFLFVFIFAIETVHQHAARIHMTGSSGGFAPGYTYTANEKLKLELWNLVPILLGQEGMLDNCNLAETLPKWKMNTRSLEILLSFLPGVLGTLLGGWNECIHHFQRALLW